MDKTTHRGITPAQIKKAIFGQDTQPIVSKPIVAKTMCKPDKAFRQQQIGNNGLILNLPFSTTQTAFQYQTPEWFTSTQKVDVSIVVPLFNTCAKDLIESWDLACDGMRFEMIFVDDNCPTNSKDMVIKEWKKRKNELKYPVGKIYYSTEKQGWSACCNIGAEHASAEIIVFIHPDVVVVSGWLKSIVNLVRQPNVGAVGALQVDISDNTFIDAGAEWSWTHNKFMQIGKEIYKGNTISKPFKTNNTPIDLTQSGEREKISSYCMAVKTKQFRFFGGFCPNLVSQEWADADFCMFIKEQGFKIMTQGYSQVFRRDISVKNDRINEIGKMYFNNKWLISGRIDVLVSAKRIEPIKEVKSIVLRRGAAHGDVLIAAAVAPALKKKYPNANIIFSTDCPEVLDKNPWINKVVEEHSERWFDLYYDMDMIYEYRPNTNILEAYADAVGVNVKDCDLFLNPEPIEGLPENYIVIHAGQTMWAGRNWSTLKFDSISSRLKSVGYNIICVGTWSDHKTSSCTLDLREKTTIQQLSTVIMNAKLFVGIDSFPMHVAQTFEVPGVCFFGSVLPETRLLNKGIKPVFADGIRCLGCHHKKHTPCTSTTTCYVGIQDCINNVTTDHVWKSILSLIQA